MVNVKLINCPMRRPLRFRDLYILQNNSLSSRHMVRRHTRLYTVSQLNFGNSVDQSYVVGFVKRYLPDFGSQETLFKKYLADPKIRSYFKRFYPLVRLKQIEKYLKQSKYYDKSFLDKIEQQVLGTKDLFLANVKKSQKIMAADFIPKVPNEAHNYAIDYIRTYGFMNRCSRFRPTPQDVVNAIKKRASVGLPDPHIRKGSRLNYVYYIISLLQSQSFNMREFVSNDSSFTPMVGAFLRSQITDTGLKARLVFAVAFGFVIVETYFNLCIKNLITDCGSCFVHGYDQESISSIPKDYMKSHKLCIDYKNFDVHITSFVICSVSIIAGQVICLNKYEAIVYRDMIAYFLTTPIFHSDINYTPKRMGIPSGSGLTSIFGSLCNVYMLCVSYHIYCKKNNLNINSSGFILRVSSDDTIVFSNDVISYHAFRDIVRDVFKIDIELESQCSPNQSKVFFLGSKWIDGLPYRNRNRMFARILFGSPNIPKMSDLQLFQSRCYEILGNTCEYEKFYKTFRIPYPNRVFRSYELMDYNTRARLLGSKQVSENRGVWEDVHLSATNANFVWRSR